MRVLVVEDEAYLAEAVQITLERAAMSVDVAADGDAALERLAVVDYDVVVLDRDLPGVHGDDVCAAIVASPGGPAVLMLTAAGALRERRRDERAESHRADLETGAAAEIDRDVAHR